jgi:hypothetical protein
MRKEIWTRPLAKGAYAVAAFNRGPTAAEMTIDFAALGVDPRGKGGARPVGAQEHDGPEWTVHDDGAVARRGAAASGAVEERKRARSGEMQSTYSLGARARTQHVPDLD